MFAIRLLLFFSNVATFCALLMFVTALVLLPSHAQAAPVLMTYAGVVLFFSVAVALAMQGRSLALGPIGRVIGYVAIWPITALIGAFVVADFADLSYARSFMAALEAVTTTSASLPTQQSNVQLHLWLACLAWSGGLFTIVGLVGFADLFTRDVNAQNDMVREADRSRWRLFMPLATGFDRNLYTPIALVYTTVTIGGWGLLIVSGVGSLDALLLALNAVSTTGFLGFDATIATLAPAAWFSLALLLAFGTVGPIFTTPRRLQTCGRRLSTAFLLVMLSAGLIATLGKVSEPMTDHLIHALTALLGLVSTTALVLERGDLALLPLGVILAVTAVGGFSYATSGGLKIGIVGTLATQVYRSLKEGVFPHSSVGRNTAGSPAQRSAIVRAQGHFVLFVLTWFIGAIAFSLRLPVEAAFTASMAAIVNAGDLYPRLASLNGWPEKPRGFGPGSLSAILMIVGRVEFILALAPLVRLMNLPRPR